MSLIPCNCNGRVFTPSLFVFSGRASIQELARRLKPCGISYPQILSICVLLQSSLPSFLFFLSRCLCTYKEKLSRKAVLVVALSSSEIALKCEPHTGSRLSLNCPLTSSAQRAPALCRSKDLSTRKDGTRKILLQYAQCASCGVLTHRHGLFHTHSTADHKDMARARPSRHDDRTNDLHRAARASDRCRGHNHRELGNGMGSSRPRHLRWGPARCRGRSSISASLSSTMPEMGQSRAGIFLANTASFLYHRIVSVWRGFIIEPFAKSYSLRQPVLANTAKRANQV
jgi:hypothetical protein